MTIEAIYEHFLNSSGISIDTRTLEKDQVFIALKGPNHDGNKYAMDAIRSGAALAIVSDPALSSEKVVVVPDTEQTLQDLARFHRNTLNIPVIGLTGSNGKTTTKELLSAILNKKYRTYATRGNLNNHIGVPLSILEIKAKHEIAVIEMGANHVGEIRHLCSIARPTHGFITNIGKAHIEGFGGVEGIKKGKSELYESLAATGGKAFVNTDEQFLVSLSRKVTDRVFYGFALTAEDPYSAQLEQTAPFVRLSWVDHNGTTCWATSSLFDRYNAQNIVTAVTLGRYFNVESESIVDAIEAYTPANNRSQLIERGKRLIILDAYNANPTSMALAISGLTDREGTRAVILGGMNELGADATREHALILDLLSEVKMDRVLLTGQYSESDAVARGFEWYESTDGIRNALMDNPIDQDVVLIKGSRSFKLESLLDLL